VREEQGEEGKSQESQQRTEGWLMRTPIRLQLALTTLIVLVSALAPAPASAAEGPVWKILSVSNPTNFEPGIFDSIVVTATNVGDAPADATGTEPITISDQLPAEWTATEILGNDAYKDPVGRSESESGGRGGMSCSPNPVPTCTTSEPVDPGDTLIVTIPVNVKSNLSPTVLNGATVSGGGASSASVGGSVTISSALPEYGVAPEGLFAATSTNQAVAHPNVTTAFFLNTFDRNIASLPASPAGPTGTPKDIRFDLPPGLVGTTVGMPRCTMAEVINESHCPADTMVGTATVIASQAQLSRLVITIPVFNIAPAPGEPVAFGFNALLFPGRLDTSVLSNGDYGVRVTAPDLTEGAQVLGSSFTIWGVPADHDGPGPDLAARNGSAGEVLGSFNPLDEIEFGGPGVGQTRVPLLTNPSQCSTPLEATLSTDSWEAPGPGVFRSASTSLGSDTGCDLLSFNPSVSMLPDTLEAGAPAGYSLDLKVPQNSEPERLGTPNVKKVVATLPLGTVISPSAADGLGDCTDAQFELHSGVAGACPNDSQIGAVRVKAPALEEPLTGEVYLAAPECDPCSPGDAQDGKMIRLFVQVVGEGEDGIVVKLEGTGVVNQQTGQFTATFNEDPQVPFSDLQLTLTGGERATLANSRTCGSATTTLDLTPWSTPYTPDATPQSTFDVDENCFSPQFNPSFTAGTTSSQAGGFSPFTLSFDRSDPDEFLNAVQIQMPPGLLGMLSRVSLCGEPQAAQGTCGPESEIGETTAETGPGADPFLVTGGRVFVTGPTLLEGSDQSVAPYGLSIVFPAVAGPYTLSGTTGNGTVVVRSALSVNPETSALTVTSDRLPTELDGIPLQLRLVNVTINRPGFMFNPTNCNPLAITGTIVSTQNASSAVSSRFQAANCAALPFAPRLTASVTGQASKADGTSFHVKLESAGIGQANIHKVDLQLPVALPSRLSTLQKACPAANFESNPASCDSESVIGTATVHTPVLNTPLTGPAYLVSHGAAGFPDVEFVLQGEGVEIVFDGKTQITKGITYSKFETVPDAPFTTFETVLPAGPHSILGVYASAKEPYNLCRATLAMPTEISGQNGAVIRDTTTIAATGCPPSLSIAKSQIKGNSVLVLVKLGEAGTVKISGNGLKTTTRKGMKAGIHTITVPLTAVGRAAERHKRKLKIKVTLTAASKTGTATTTLKA
jgi:hypothetical protein